MEAFIDALKTGGKTNSLGRVNDILQVILTDKSRLNELYECLFADDAWVRMRAADCLEKVCRVHPEWIEPYIATMLRDLTLSTQPSIQWHLAQIIAEVRLSGDQKQRAVTWLKELLLSHDIDWIVSVNAMKTLVQFRRSGIVTARKLIPLFEIQQQHASKTVRKKAAQFLQDV